MRRFQLVTERAEEFKAARILDIGCAQGNYAITLAERGFRVVACDLRRSYLDYARMKDDSGIVSFVVANAYDLPFKTASFDLVIAGEILEHLAYPEKLINECRRILAKDGALIGSTPNGENVFSRLPLFADIPDRASLVSGECQPDSEGHLFLFSREELHELMTKLGFSGIRIEFHSCSLLNIHFDALICHLPLRTTTIVDWLASRVPFANRLLSEGMVIVSRRRPIDQTRKEG
jgi:SAM-dependent methyltransferase